MTSEQFLQEVLASPAHPADFEEIYRGFQKYQRAAMKTLQEFHRVCELNRIPYQLAYGSLLGAIRDNGQIPWDYDIDVFVAYQDKPRLIEALKKDLDERFYFYCPEVNQKCRHVIMRLAPNGYRSEALHVDVFYYVGTADDPEERKAHAAQLKDISMARYWRLVKPREAAGGKLRTYLGLRLRKTLYGWRSLKKIEAEYARLCEKYPLEVSAYLITADTFSGDCVFRRENMVESQLHQTEDGYFHVPVRYEEILTEQYGDYKSAPPLQSRIEEVLSHYRYLQFFEKKRAKGNDGR